MEWVGSTVHLNCTHLRYQLKLGLVHVLDVHQVKWDSESQDIRSTRIIVDYSELREWERLCEPCRYRTATAYYLCRYKNKSATSGRGRVSLLSLGGGRGWLTPNCRTDPDTPRGSTRPPPGDRFTLPLTSRVQAQIQTTRHSDSM